MGKHFLAILLLVCGIAIAAPLSDSLKKGIFSLESGEYREAIALLEKARQEQTSDTYVYAWLGNAYLRAGMLDKAKESYESALKLDPQNQSIRYSLAYVSLLQRQDEKALEEFAFIKKTAPRTEAGKLSDLRIQEIQRDLQEQKLIIQWREKELEEKAKKEKADTKEEEEGVDAREGMEGMPPDTDIMPIEGMPDDHTPRVVVKSPEALVKELRFGVDTKRREAARLLLAQKKGVLEPFYDQFVTLAEREKDLETRKQILLIIGKTGLPQAGEFLVGLLSAKNESFDIKLTALQAVVSAGSESVADRLSNVLKSLVDARLAMKASAKNEIEKITKKIEDFEVKKVSLQQELYLHQQQHEQLRQKLSMMPEDTGFLPEGQAAGARTSLNLAEIKKIRDDMKKEETEIRKKNRLIRQGEEENGKLIAERQKYEFLLAQKFGDAAPVPMAGMAPVSSYQDEMMQVQVDFSSQASQVTDELQQEQLFALNLIEVIGLMGQTKHLSDIERAWKEYESRNFLLRYGLARARLGNYGGLEQLVSRLKEDYGQISREEITLRTGIIAVLGTYLRENKNPEYSELLDYISGNDSQSEVKNAASKILGKTAKPQEKSEKNLPEKKG
jgi:tetratricopeptide (TPR) repeat protein